MLYRVNHAKDPSNVSDCCLTPDEELFVYVMAAIHYHDNKPANCCSYPFNDVCLAEKRSINYQF